MEGPKESLISKWSILSALSSAIRKRKDSKEPVPYENVEADIYERADRLDEAEKLLTQEGSTDPQSIPTYDELDKELLTELGERLQTQGQLKRGISYDEGDAKYLIESLEKKYLDFAEKAKRQDYRMIKQDLIDILDAAMTKAERGEEEEEEEEEVEEERGEEEVEEEESTKISTDLEAISETLFSYLPPDVLKLGQRVKDAENRVLKAAQMIQQLGQVPGIYDKIKNMEPYALESEGAEMRKRLWLLEKRIIRLERRRRETEHLDELREFEEKWAKGLDTTVEPSYSDNEDLHPEVPAKEKLWDLRNAIKRAREKMTEAHESYNEFSRRLAQIKEGIELDTLCFCAMEIANMKSALNALTGGQFENGEEIEYIHNRRLYKCHTKFDIMCGKIKTIGSVPEIIDIAKKYMAEIANYLIILQKKIDGGDPLRVEVTNNRSILNSLAYKLRMVERKGSLQVRLSDLLFDDELERDVKLMTITESLDLLKIIKINKIDLGDALNEKVSTSDLNDKVWKDALLSKMDVFKYIIHQNTKTFEEHEIFRKERSENFEQLLSKTVHVKDLRKFEKFVNREFTTICNEILNIPHVPQPIQAAAAKKFIGERKEKCLICCHCLEITKPKVFTTPGLTPYHAYELEGVLTKQAHMTATYDKEYYGHEFARKTKDIFVYRESKGFRSKKGSLRNCGGEHTKTTATQRFLRQMPCIPCPIPEICTCLNWNDLKHMSDVKDLLGEIIDKNIDPNHYEDVKFMKKMVQQVANESAKAADYDGIQNLLFGKVFKKIF